MSKLIEGTNSKTGYGTGKDIIEILNVGFEPFLTRREYGMLHNMNITKKKLNKLKYAVKYIDNKIDNLNIESEVYDTNISKSYNTYISWLEMQKEIIENDYIEKYNERLKKQKEDFKNLLNKNIKLTRTIHTKNSRKFNHDDQFRNIAIFESDLTRTFECKNFEFSDSIISVVTYYTEIFNSLIHNGFIYNKKKYVFFTAGAGQTRQKKSTFVRKDLLEKHKMKLFCGLTEDIVNELGGMNTNKYLAYTSLSQSNTEIWKKFNIKKSIVVPDIEFKIPNKKVRHIYTSTPDDIEEVESLEREYCEVDYKYKKAKLNKESIDKSNRKERKEYNELMKKYSDERKEIKKKISEIKSKYYSCEIKNMDVDIPFTDGFGISLKERGSFMVRLPFVKGLISYAPFTKFKEWCMLNKYEIKKVKDIYGVEHDIIKEGIEYIFTESQFKMHKYYTNEYDEDGNLIKSGWQKYQDNFIKYGCEACRCNVEENVKLNAKTNYQILQTLTTEMTDDDIIKIAGQDLKDIKGYYRKDIQSMLNILNANDKNNKKSWYQKSLIKYPEMLKDPYSKESLRNAINSSLNKMYGGKFKVNGAYTFIIPDVLACMQWWFLGERDLTKLGVIHDENKVYCSLFKDDEEVDCLRSPHLDHAHCIRNNMKKSEVKDWFKTQGLYIGVNDIMCKFLMFDVDGDKSLVHNNKTIIDNAKQFQNKYGMIPNFYDMAKARPMYITKDNLFDGIVLAYHHGNIGTPSNEITKITNKLGLKSTKETVEEAINVIAFRCLDVNMTIDYAKTLWKMEVTKPIRELYKKYGSKKVPNFFRYAKGKDINQVEKCGEGNIDRIYDVINKKIKEEKDKIKSKDISEIKRNMLKQYTYKTLMSEDVDIKTDKALNVIKLYNETDEINSIKKANTTCSDLEDETKTEMLQEMLDINNKKKLFIETLNMEEDYIVNVLVKYLNTNDDNYTNNKIRKDLLWKLFGETIYNNICDNIEENTSVCMYCGKRFVKNNNKTIACSDSCKDEIEKANKLLWWENNH